MRPRSVAHRTRRAPAPLRTRPTRALPAVEALEGRPLLSALHPIAAESTHAHAHAHAHAQVQAHAPKPHVKHAGHAAAVPTVRLTSPAKSKGVATAAAAGGTVPVQVTNTSANPVPTIDARTPVVEDASFEQNNNSNVGMTSFTVPAGQILSVEDLNVTSDILVSNVKVSYMIIGATYQGKLHSYEFSNFTTDPAGQGHLDEGTLLFADPGSTVNITIVATGQVSQGSSYNILLTGHLQPPS